jgi:hypothetical protein
MTTRAEVLEELSRLERVQADLAGVASRTDSDRALDLIRLRRVLSEQIGRIGQIAERYFEEAGDAALTQQFRNNFSAMRSSAATHQANWPAVRLAEAGEEYQRSARAVREANRAFVAWMRETLS